MIDERIQAIKRRKTTNRIIAAVACVVMFAMLCIGSVFIVFSAMEKNEIRKLTEDEPARVARDRVGHEIEWIGTEYTFNRTRARVAFGRHPGNRRDVILRYDDLRKEWWIEDENIY